MTIWLLCMPQLAFGLESSPLAQAANSETPASFENFVSMVLRFEKLRIDFDHMTTALSVIASFKSTHVERSLQSLKASLASVKKSLQTLVKLRADLDQRPLRKDFLQEDTEPRTSDSASLDLQWRDTREDLRKEIISLYGQLVMLGEFNSQLDRRHRYQRSKLKKLRKELLAIAKLGRIKLKL